MQRVESNHQDLGYEPRRAPSLPAFWKSVMELNHQDLTTLARFSRPLSRRREPHSKLEDHLGIEPIGRRVKSPMPTPVGVEALMVYGGSGRI